MEDPKPPFPAWLPWATAACLGALALCLGELWAVERAQGRLLRDEGRVAEAGLQGLRNQMEAERILSRRQIENLRSAGPLGNVSAALLQPPAGIPAQHLPRVGVVVWNESGNGAFVRFGGPGEPEPARDFQLWLLGDARSKPVLCGRIHAPPNGNADGSPVRLPADVADSDHFVLVEGTAPPGSPGAAIVLASLPAPGKIDDR